MKAILFDMDGVLIDSFESWFRLFNDTLRHFKKSQIDVEEFRQNAWGKATKKCMNYFEEDDEQSIKDYMAQNYERYIGYTKLMNGADETLSYLKNRYKLGIITNSLREITIFLLTRFEIIDNFNAIVTEEDVKNTKPDPEMILLACKNLGIDAKNTIVIGDSATDITAAKEAECLAVGYKINGDKSIEGLSELKEIFP